MVVPSGLIGLPGASAALVHTYAGEVIAPSLLALGAGATTLAMGDNDVTAAFPMGLTTEFFGQETDLFWVGSNGFVTQLFITPDGCCQGNAIPTAGGPDGMVAGFWADLDPSQGGTVRFQTLPAPAGSGASEVLVVEWRDVPIHDQPGLLNTFQVQVFDNGVYEVHYDHAQVPADMAATVGIENAAGSVGLEMIRASSLVLDDTAVRFTPTQVEVEDPPFSLDSLTPDHARPGEQVQLFGQGLDGGDAVSFGGFPATIVGSSGNGTFLLALVPNLPPGVVDVSVTDGGTGRVSTLSGAFTVDAAPAGSGVSYVVESIPFAPLALGGNVTTFPPADDQTFPLDLGFSVPFFGEPRSSVMVSSNGFLQFGSDTASGCCSGQIMPDPTPPNGVLAALWTDLLVANVSTGLVTVFDATPRAVRVVSWENATECCTFGNETIRFQIHVRSDGVFEFHYETVAIANHGVTIGIEDANGAAGTLLFQGTSLHVTQVAVRLTPVSTGSNVTISSVTPSQGFGGDAVHVEGTGFQPGAIVLFGSAASSANVTSSTSLDTTVPPNAGEGPVSITVVNPDGSNATLPDAFTLLAAPTTSTPPPTSTTPPNATTPVPTTTTPPPPASGPVVEAVTPSEGLPGDRVLVEGSGFAPGATVRVGGVFANATVRASTQIDVAVPNLPPGTFSLVVTNPDGQSGAAPGGFTVNAVPLSLSAVSPAEARAGQTVTIFGQGFRDAVVLLGGQGAPVTSASSTRLTATLPSGGPGALDVTVVNGDGASATLAGALRRVAGPQITEISPSSTLQGGAFGVRGVGFGNDSAVLVGPHVASRVTFVNATFLLVVLDPEVDAGIHDVTVVSAGLFDTRAGALVVRPAPDLAVVDLQVEDGSVGAAGAGVPTQGATGVRVTATVRNVGAAPAGGGRVAFTIREDSSSYDPFGRDAPGATPLGSVDLPLLAPGASATATVLWSPGASVGDHVVSANASLAGDLRAQNNLAEARVSRGVSGLRGVDPCGVGCEPQAPPAPELYARESVVRSVLEAEDRHLNATLAFSLQMRLPRFDFVGNDFTFDSALPTTDGSSVECTTWRFLGGRGSIFADLLPEEGLGGSATVVAANASSATGENVTERTTSTYVAGVEVDRQGPETETRAVTQARATYDAASLQRIRVEASTLRGDFSRCTTHRADGTSFETFAFAALPANVNDPRPSRSGFGTAAVAVVDYGAQRETRTRETSPSLGEDLYVTPGEPGSLVAEVHYADGVASTRFAFTQLSGVDGGPGNRLKPTPECTEWIGGFTEVGLKATAEDTATRVTLRLLGTAFTNDGPMLYEDVGLDMVALSLPGGMTGSILICDRPGDGLARISLSLASLDDGLAAPALVRVHVEGPL